MRLEILARRLAEKTNTPELEGVILDPTVQLSNECMIWTGAKTGGRGPRMVPVRSSRRGLYFTHTQDKAYGIIRWQKQSIMVHRLVFQLIHKPNFEYRMLNQCGNTLCVNPHHYEVVEHIQNFQEPDPDDEDDEAEEIIEILLTEYSPQNFNDVITNPLTQDLTHSRIREVLISLNKEHLT